MSNKIINQYFNAFIHLKQRIKQSALIMEKHYPKSRFLIIIRIIKINIKYIAEFIKKFLVPMDLDYSKQCVLYEKRYVQKPSIYSSCFYVQKTEQC